MAQIKAEFDRLIGKVKAEAEAEPHYVDPIHRTRKTESQNTRNYLLLYLLRATHETSIESQREKILQILNSCYDGNQPREPRIRWLVYGYLYGKNRHLEDWLPGANSLFDEYDEYGLDVIRWNQYNQKSLNGGFEQLEATVKKHRTEKTINYKIRDIDFSRYRDDADISSFENIKVVVPKSREAAIYWGWHTKWCCKESTNEKLISL